MTTSDTTRSFLVAFAVIAAVVAASCDKVPLTSPTGSTIQLSSSTSSVPIDGSAEITATVIESAGTAVQNGTTVVFRSDIGRMDPPEAQTSNGRAISRFFAGGSSGIARINAYSGGAATGGSVTSGNTSTPQGAPLQILVGGAAATRVTVRAEPPTIPQTGGTVQIFANVADANGSPVLGAPVTFTTIASGNTSGGGPGVLSAPSTQTNANGVAQTSLTTNQTTTVTATIATAGATGGTVTANVVVTALAAPSVAISCPTSGNSSGFSVGVPVNCTISLPSPSTAPVQNVTVNWGDGTGEQPQGSGATTVSHTYSAPGTYTVTAAATDLNSQRATATTSVVITRLLPNGTLSVPDTGTVGVPVSMTFAPSTTNGQPTTSVAVDFGDGTSRSFSPVSGPFTFTKTYSTEGGFTVTATATDASGQQAQSIDAITISRGTAPTAGLTQTSFTAGDPMAVVGTSESFNVIATASSGLSIRSVVVRNMTTGQDLYTASSGTSSTGTTFATDRVKANDILRATVTDSAGNTATADVIVR